MTTMSVEEAKEYVDTRFKIMSESMPTVSRAQITNRLIVELKEKFDFTLTTPFGNPIMGITEDDQGIIYHI